MKKFFIISALILLSITGVSAQTGPKGEVVSARRSQEGEKPASSAGKRGKTRGPSVLKLGPSTTYLKNGLSTGDVVRYLGQPASVSERRDGEIRLATYTFQRGEGRILVAEFENGALVSSRTETEGLAQNKEPKR